MKIYQIAIDGFDCNNLGCNTTCNNFCIKRNRYKLTLIDKHTGNFGFDRLYINCNYVIAVFIAGDDDSYN